ncbi:sulfotransferase [Ovoidimarina sediminis]|uniref:sulfotransferase n=1 Tax=Ovoidimarina sediminis TaxID=3079856 RepID=UPI00291239BE|nr:sulfotransferase [Rhodophyticola sp. MJ-SS7]MDU8945870.1 sulfotransferase [Rhodophyticola sp. MJ-SS7]
MAPVILFGMGAAKAGSSWLYQWLQRHPECHFRAVKELHYFDTFDLGSPSAKVKALTQQADRARANSAQLHVQSAISELRDLFRQPENVLSYIDYLEKGAGDARVVGDITPAYALLSRNRLRHMAMIEGSMFLYLLRDPVDRLWSHIRMIAGRQSPRGIVTAEAAEALLSSALAGHEPAIVARGDYHMTLTNLLEAVPEQQRLVLFYEELIEGPAAHRICDFLGIERQTPPQERTIMLGADLKRTDEQHARMRDFLQPQYDAVEEIMGRLPATWTGLEKV